MKKNLITVQNAEGEPETQAEILVQNKIDYTPKVSVVIPVYNVEPYLRECLESVVKQTLKEIEIICVDDGSTDNSLKILREYARSDKRFTIMTQKNLYAGVARNAGLNIAKGEYLCFLDSDDFFELDLLERQYEQITRKKADLCICRSQMKTEKGNLDMPWGLRKDLIPSRKVFSPEDVADNVFQICCGYTWDKLFKRSNIIKYNRRFQSIHHSNDTYFVLSYLIICKKITFIDDVLVHYRYTPHQSISQVKEKDPECFMVALSALYNRISQYGTKYLDSYLNLINSVSRWHFSSMSEQEASVKVVNYTDKLYKSIRRELEDENYRLKINKLINENKRRIYKGYKSTYKLFGFIPLLSIEEM